ncbi:MAG TPA: inverse autotransporter beta domain-containing protein [Pirellulaceae bacterium]|jgi:hypothetical protein|nr:inverse autotransporter beta domain-containing protein [Pirellulaceae bacterium]
MKRLAGFVILSLVVLATWTPELGAQGPAGPTGQSGPAFDSVFQSPLGGLVWLGATGADQGLGYDGSYFTAGAKQPLFDDFLNGEWFAEGQAHVSANRGQFFSNLGLERVFHIKPAKTDVGANVFVDYDADEYEEFGHTYWQVGVGGFLKTPYFDFYANGYLPQGQMDHRFRDTSFVGNQIVVPGIDSALQGFDAKFRVPIPHLSMIQGYFDLGGYYYRSDLVEPFGGLTTSLGAHPYPGVAVNLTVNQDEMFNTSGFLQLILHAGGDGAPTSAPRALERSVRNDHVVRVNQPSFVAINPLTGTPWRVVHVDSDAAVDVNAGSGTAEDPYSQLAQADPTQFGASIAQPADIIFVHQGANDFVNHDTGIALQDLQWLLGEGVPQYIPIANYGGAGTGGIGLYRLLINENGQRPQISNIDNNTAATVQLANANVVRGLEINSASTEAAIRGDVITHGLINNNIIFGEQGNAILVDGLTGTFWITDNTIDNQVIDPLIQTFDAVSLNNVTAANILIDNNVIGSRNELAPFGIGDFLGGDGIHIASIAASQVAITNNRIASTDPFEPNFGDGVEIRLATDTAFLIRNNNIGNNIASGININTSEDIYAEISSNNIVDNGGAGIAWTQATGQLLVFSEEGFQTQNISENQAGGVRVTLLGAFNDDDLFFYAADNTFAGNSNGTASAAAIQMDIAGDAGSAEGPNFAFDIRNNRMIDNDLGVILFQDTGAQVLGNIYGNVIADNGLAVGTFVNSNLAAGVSRLDLRIDSNTILNSGNSNAGNVLTNPLLDPSDEFDDGTGGIYGSVTGTSIANYDIRDNYIEGTGLEFTPEEFGDAGIQFFFNVDQFTTPDSPYEPPISSVTMYRNTIIDTFNHARTFNVYGDSQVQITSVFNVSRKTLDLDGAPILDDGEDIGFQIKTNDRAVVGLNMEGDVMQDHQLNGMFLESRDQSRIFSRIVNSQFLRNGRADEDDPPLDLFYNSNIEVFAQDQSIQVFNFQNNTINQVVDDEFRVGLAIHNEAGSEGQIYAIVNNNIFFGQIVDPEDGTVEVSDRLSFYMYQQGSVGVLPNAGTMSLALFGNQVSDDSGTAYLVENRNDPLNIPPFYFTYGGNEGFDPLISINPPQSPGQPSTIRVGQVAPVNLAPLTDFIRKP